VRIRTSLSIGGFVAGSAAVSTVALGQSTWGAPAPAPSADASDASAAPSGPQISTWGAAAVYAPADAGTTPAPSAAPKRIRRAVLVESPASAASSAKSSTEPPTESGPSDVGFAVGIRGGYGIPFGSGNGAPLSSVLLGVVPVGVDAGWFFTPHFYVGAYFIYGFGVGADQDNDTCSTVDQECSASMVRFGLTAHWHFAPQGIWDPWIGAGLGYESILLSATSDVDGSTLGSAALSGVDLSLEAGLDLKPAHFIGLGPYVELASGPYVVDNNCTAPSASSDSTCSPSGLVWHGWISFGARFRTNL